MKKPKLPNRKSLRLKGHDYASIGYYFITIDARKHLWLFGTIKNGKMYPNKLGEIIAEEWEFTREIRKNVKLHEYVVMPNHFHALVEICYSENKSNVPGEYKAPSQTLSAIVRGFKGAVTSKNKSLKLGNEKGVWHNSFNDQVIRDEQHLINVKNYIINNVRDWKY
ncbi:transposase [Brumimicrobium sp.]|uniref:transposase n=1 Tax=Brumimicrobium sp. TaxID=2029867 RepID=UPI003A95AB14